MDLTPEPEYQIACLLEIVDRDLDLARQVAETFVAMGDRLPRQLALALEARQSSAVVELAHEIKGMSAMIGARRLCVVAAAAEEDPSRASPVDDLHREWQQVNRCLSQFLSSGAPT